MKDGRSNKKIPNKENFLSQKVKNKKS